MGRKIGSLTPLALHILVALSDGPRHGYAVIRDIEERTSGALNLRSGTLYVALQRLTEAGMIEEVAAPPESTDARRKFFALTEAGRGAALREMRSLERLVADAQRRLGSAVIE
ncbi:MAG: PadR family transcriptional regulator [Acidobacteriota bacterium]